MHRDYEGQSVSLPCQTVNASGLDRSRPDRAFLLCMIFSLEVVRDICSACSRCPAAAESKMPGQSTRLFPLNWMVALFT